MAHLTIRDNAVWAKHIEGDPRIVASILSLPENAPITLLIEGRPVRFLKMQDGRDGRPTRGLRPDPLNKPFWDAMQDRRGDVVSVELAEPTPEADAGLKALSSLLSEWESAEDAEAYDRL